VIVSAELFDQATDQPQLAPVLQQLDQDLEASGVRFA